MSDDLTPRWAVELEIKFEQLRADVKATNTGLNSHSEWATRNIKDHETRMRAIEATQQTLANVIDKLARLEEKFEQADERTSQIEKKMWVAIGGLTVIVGIIQLVAFNINLN